MLLIFLGSCSKTAQNLASVWVELPQILKLLGIKLKKKAILDMAIFFPFKLKRNNSIALKQ